MLWDAAQSPSCPSSKCLSEGTGEKLESSALAEQSVVVSDCQAPGSQSVLLSSSFPFCRITWKCIWGSSSLWSLQEQVITLSHCILPLSPLQNHSRPALVLLFLYSVDQNPCGVSAVKLQQQTEISYDLFLLAWFLPCSGI